MRNHLTVFLVKKYKKDRNEHTFCQKNAMQGGLISCSTSNETENYDMGTLLDELS